MDAKVKDNTFLIRIARKRAFHLAIIGLVALIISSVFSGPFFIKPKYKSFSVLYPSNTIAYGSETVVEQMLQLLEANDIRDQVIKKFNLAKHYGIDSTGKYYFSELRSAYEENIVVGKTKYESINIEANDESPVVARDIVLEIIDLANMKARQLQREKSNEVLVMLERQIENNDREISSIEAEINFLRINYGLLDYKAQVKELTKQYMKIISSGANKNKENEIKKLLANLEQKGGVFLALTDKLDNLRKISDNIKVQYDNTLRDVSKELTYSTIITKPEVADKKSYPIRWLIVLVATFSTLFFAIIIFTIIEKPHPFFASKGNN